MIFKRLQARLNDQPSDIPPAAWRMLKFSIRKSRNYLENQIVLRRPGYWEHFGVHDPRNNAGDTVLFSVIEDLFDGALGAQNWFRSRLRDEVTTADVSRLNEDARAVLVGGGGLLISDTYPNPASGWQWKIGLEELRALTPPLILFAIGYNQFRGADPFPNIFKEHLAATVEKSAFFGMRNTGSMERTRAYLPERLRERVVLQPCMTTVLKKFHRYFLHPRPPLKTKRLALNLAFDRADKRYGSRFEEIGKSIVEAMRWAVQEKWEVVLALHAWDDDPIVPLFHSSGVPFTIKRLNLCSADEVVRFYAEMPLTIGMRGHAQMIPFGCGNAILSLISHDKLGFFLEDIGRPEWGVEISGRNIRDDIIDRIRGFYLARDAVAADINALINSQWNITCRNLALISKAVD